MLNDKDREIIYNNLEGRDFENHKAIRGQTKFARYKYSKVNFKDRVKKANLDGQGNEKFTIPSRIKDIYNRIDILIGLKISEHTDTLAEESDIIDHKYKRDETQNKQQYRNALNKFPTI